jgi:hypothetical protein
MDFLGGGMVDCLPFSISAIFYLWLLVSFFGIFGDETDSNQPKIHGKIQNLKKKIREPKS